MIFEQLQNRIPIEKGWSGDRKYCVTDREGTKYLLRIAAAERYDRRAAAFDHTSRAAKLQLPMPLPLEFGTCSEGIYTIESWIDGQDAETLIPTLPESAQYQYGLDAGRILRKLHSIPAPAETADWASYFNRKIDRKLSMYGNCPLKYKGGEVMVEYLQTHRHLLRNRPLSYQHGDYHIGNMMIDSSGQLVVIDFDKDDYGDPWEEFNRIVWSAQASPLFASGMVDGYFGGPVPSEFWDLLVLYICSNSLGSLPWAIPFGDQEIETMNRQAAEILQWYDHMKTTVPGWYHCP